MTIDLQRVAAALGGEKKTPEGYVCKCPCHDDKSASLSLTESSSGKLIVNCFAGCKWEDVIEELARRNLVTRSSKPKQDKYKDAKLYTYYSLTGAPIARTVKLPSKKMWIERYDNGSWVSGLNGIQVPLYNLKSVLAADVVYLAEGEKDAETVINAGLCGTTNQSGAKHWPDHLTEVLRGKTIVICQDNDEAGRARTELLVKKLSPVAKELRLFEPPGVGLKGDISDWVANGGDVKDVFALSVSLAKTTPRVRQRAATRDDYYKLIDDFCGRPRRDIFSGRLMTFDTSDGLWNPTINYLEILRSECLVRSEGGNVKYNKGDIQSHLAAYEHSKPKELLIDIPVWDGRDRISEMAYMLKLKPEYGEKVTDEALSEMLKEWCSLVFERLKDPMVQNRVFVLQGGQGIGKDTWIEMLVGGLGQWCFPFTLMNGDKDVYLNVNRGLIMNISEFDRTNKMEASTLKDLITGHATQIRAAYDRDSKYRENRASFISSANVVDILRDHTGNRRFMIFEVESIDWQYRSWTKEERKEWQMQVLAEAKYLAEEKYRATASSRACMDEYIQESTPTDPEEMIVQMFVVLVNKSLTLSTKGEILVSDPEVLDIKTKIRKELGIHSAVKVSDVLKRHFMIQKRVGDTRLRVYRIPDAAMKLYIPENSSVNNEIEPVQGLLGIPNN